MKVGLKFLLCLLFPVSLWGQGSVEFVSRKEVSPQDSAEIMAKIHKAWQLLEESNDSSYIYFSQAVDSAHHHNFLSGYAQAQYGLSKYWRSKQDYTRAIQAARLAQDMVIGLRDTSAIVSVFDALMEYSSLKGDNVASFRTYQQLKHYLPGLSSEFTPLIARIEHHVANAYADKGSRNEAAQHYQNVLKLLSEKDSTHITLIAAVYNGLATVAIESDLMSTAFEYIDRAEQLLAAHPGMNPVLSMVCRTNKALAFLQDKSYDSTVYYGKIALAEAEQLKKDFYIPSISSFLTSALIRLSRAEEGLPYARKGYQVAKNLGAEGGIITASYSLGYNLLTLKKYIEAEPYVQEALRLSEQTGRYSDISNAYNYLAEINEGLGNYPEAYRYMRKYAAIQDSLRGKANASALAAVEAKFRVAENESKLNKQKLLVAEQENNLRRKNLWLIISVLSAVSFGGLLLSLYKSNQQKNKLKKERIANLEHQNELNLLYARLKGEEAERSRLSRELHDGIVVLFSAIKMNLSVLPEKHTSLDNAEDFNKIIRRLDAATGELRKAAHNLLPDTLLEGGLTEALYYFCKDLEQSSQMKISFQQFVEMPRFRTEMELSVFRIVQELLQNIFKHAKAKHVIVQLSHDDNLLNITIEDDGISWDYLQHQNTTKGLGLKNIKERIQALKGTIDIHSIKDKGTSLYIEVDTKDYILNEDDGMRRRISGR